LKTSLHGKRLEMQNVVDAMSNNKTIKAVLLRSEAEPATTALVETISLQPTGAFASVRWLVMVRWYYLRSTPAHSAGGWARLSCLSFGSAATILESFG
jgi:hypothetical protein